MGATKMSESARVDLGRRLQQNGESVISRRRVRLARLACDHQLCTESFCALICLSDAEIRRYASIEESTDDGSVWIWLEDEPAVYVDSEWVTLTVIDLDADVSFLAVA